ncbi:putative TIM-barrel fold enzyme [Tetragenococcus muriaticus 3MR10-3]|uniref:Putative TIM-barrel fold enzyme n=1 Tax=Tetragenococcus muriaticus 3MR10-3 TaxID=1302648 RepID=A0A091CCQ9_9ENTE|nr:putative TIM-barrel fold enzyme [Tetragenococcus muriaticus 3MR10-3]
MSEQFIPNITTELRKDIVKVPEAIQEASGIIVFGKKTPLYYLYNRYCDYSQYKR